MLCAGILAEHSRVGGVQRPLHRAHRSVLLRTSSWPSPVSASRQRSTTPRWPRSTGAAPAQACVANVSTTFSHSCVLVDPESQNGSHRIRVPIESAQPHTFRALHSQQNFNNHKDPTDLPWPGGVWPVGVGSMERSRIIGKKTPTCNCDKTLTLRIQACQNTGSGCNHKV